MIRRACSADFHFGAVCDCEHDPCPLQGDRLFAYAKLFGAFSEIHRQYRTLRAHDAPANAWFRETVTSLSGSYGRQAFSALERNAVSPDSIIAASFSRGATFQYCAENFARIE
jgi:hypothetical protein